MKLRVIDAGTVSAPRSQSAWHGIAGAMSATAGPTLSFCRPAKPYVCIGYHSSLAEIDLPACRAAGLPVIRRQLGGGPVYVDGDQLFFQLTLPRRLAPPRVEDLYRRFLGPAVAAFRALGVPAALRGGNDIAVGERKISGTAAGEIGEALTVVGNVIFRFDHRRMAGVLAVPGAAMRDECLRLMRRHVSSLAAEGRAAVTPREAKAALVAAYAAALGLAPRTGALTPDEAASIERWERRLLDPAWLAGEEGRAHRPERPYRVKICAGVWVFAAKGQGFAVEASVAGGKLDRVAIAARGRNGTGRRPSPMSAALAGQPADGELVARRLEPFGAAGRRVLALLAPGLKPR